MELVRVKESQSKYFAAVAPREVLGLLSLPGCIAVGAVDDIRGVGIIVLSASGKKDLTIEWLYVDEDFRGKGYGGALMEKAFEIGKANSFEKINARLFKDDDFEALQLYLLQWEFGWTKTFPGEWNALISDVYTQPAVLKMIENKGNLSGIKPLSEVSNKELSLGINDAVQNGYNMTYDCIKNRAFLDKEISVVSMAGDKVNGFFLLHRSGKVLCPVALWAKGDDLALAGKLIGAATKHGVSKLKTSDIIRITTTTDATYKYASLLLSGLEDKEVYVMQADVNALERISVSEGESDDFKSLFFPEDIPEGGFSVCDFEVR